MDAEIQSAFSDAPPPQVVAGAPTDPEISQAFGIDVKHMPDGSVYTGQPWQDAILKAFNPGGQDTPVGVVAGKLGNPIAPIAAGYRGLIDIGGQLLKGKSPSEATLAAVPDVQRIAASGSRPDDPNATGLTAQAQDTMNYPTVPTNWPGVAGKALGGLSERLGGPPALSALAEGAPAAASMLLGLGRKPGAESMVEPDTGASGQIGGSVESTQAALNAAQSGQSMGAASTAPDISKATPELQQAIGREAQKTGGIVNETALRNQLEADSLPVPGRLTEGQATRDPTLYSDEINNRAQQPEMPAFLNWQHRNLVENLQAIRDEAGPEVFSTNPVEHADTLIQAYKDDNKVADAKTSAAYQALRDANGGAFPVDAKALLDNASTALHQQLLFDHAPKAVMTTLGRLADSGSMTFENFESLRTNLARIQRSMTADGNEKAAAGIIRGAMEQLPLQPGAAALKPLADAARATAKAQFDKVNGDPAYSAALDGSVPPDRFVQRFIINGNRDDIATMRTNLAGNDTAIQTMGTAAVDHLRQSAGIDAQGNGRFGQARFNKNMNTLSPKLQVLVPPQVAEHLQALGNYARNIQERPAGAYVNEPNTMVVALKHAAGAGAETAANALIPGLQVGSRVAKAVAEKKAAAQVKAATAPGAGLNRVQRLNDLLKPQP